MEEDKQNNILELTKYILIMAGISEPTQIENQMVQEAIVYANIDMYVSKPLTLDDFRSRRIVEIKALSYFMRKKNCLDKASVK